VQRGTRRIQPACFARAQARPARPDPPTGDYPATTLRPGSPHSKQQKPLPSRFQQERFSALAKGNPLRYSPNRFGEADVRSPCLPASSECNEVRAEYSRPVLPERRPAQPAQAPLPATTRQLPSGQVHPTASSRSPCRPDFNRKGSLPWPKVTRFDTTRTVLGKQTSGAPASSKLRVQRGTRRMQPACFARAQVRPARPGPPTGDYPATTLRPGSPHSKQQKPLPSRFQQERFSALAKGNPLRYNPDRFGEADVRSPCFQQAPSATRYASNAPGLFCQSAGPPSPPRPPYRRLPGNYPQARFTPQQVAEAPAVQISTGKVLCLGQR
jgi:hypothetical protein